MTAEKGLFIREVLHRASISAGEAGTEAAASEAVMPPSAIPENLETVIVNRPFLFLTRDVQTGKVLFLGRVVEPGPLVEG